MLWSPANVRKPLPDRLEAINHIGNAWRNSEPMGSGPQITLLDEIALAAMLFNTRIAQRNDTADLRHTVSHRGPSMTKTASVEKRVGRVTQDDLMSNEFLEFIPVNMQIDFRQAITIGFNVNKKVEVGDLQFKPTRREISHAPMQMDALAGLSQK
ncbi:hypothetical protein [Thalassoroseus pseudoceratinae]|uniref:hypothetical protein n=1 Tax=Thalassoroseus pseudoceratinae TaxID=2713176 RepID=UPI00141F2AFB|nr:hypothetical protein [Thalassoroseus pseudoceratinae]